MLFIISMNMPHDDITFDASVHVAVIQDGATIYRAKSPENCAPIQSAVATLIQGIYDLKPEQARRIVRRRILTTLPLSESITGIVKVAAKRISAALTPADLEKMLHGAEQIVDLTIDSIGRPDALSLPAPHLGPETSDAQWLELARRLATSTHQNAPQAPKYASDRPIAALLVSSENKLLSAAINTNAKNRTLHAEMNLIAGLQGQRIPRGARLFTTLKPCKMCAGMIHDSAEDLASLRVIFAEDDPGTHGRNTALDRLMPSIQSQWKAP